MLQGGECHGGVVSGVSSSFRIRQFCSTKVLNQMRGVLFLGLMRTGKTAGLIGHSNIVMKSPAFDVGRTGSTPTIGNRLFSSLRLLRFTVLDTGCSTFYLLCLGRLSPLTSVGQ
jgi:hypothetical protein